ncbi:hypothetical protein acdb102_03800 [Acidothermaceae bacterium B102]|nr:hypothetical protein acdb102_03800 [Acidothermaceae bacterium B102]
MRHIAMASTGTVTAAEAINGPDVDTATTATASSGRSASGGLVTADGRSLTTGSPYRTLIVRGWGA